MNTTEVAKTIRKNLKNDLGLNARQVGVRAPDVYAVYVTVKDPAVDIKDVEKIAKAHESYERDERTGEIMTGGNTFVFVTYSDEARDAKIAA